MLSCRALFSVAALAQHRRFLRLSRDKRSAALHWRGSRRASSAPRPAAFVAPCSLGAFLAAPVPPKRFSFLATFCRVQPRPFSFAPLLGRPPGGFLVGALKRISFRPLIVATSPRDGHTGACRCWVRRRQKARPTPLRIETVRGLLSGGSGSLARTGRRVSHSGVVQLPTVVSLWLCRLCF